MEDAVAMDELETEDLRIPLRKKNGYKVVHGSDFPLPGWIAAKLAGLSWFTVFVVILP